MRAVLVLLLVSGVQAFLSSGVRIGCRNSRWEAPRSTRVRSFPEYVPSDVSEIEEPVSARYKVQDMMGVNAVMVLPMSSGTS